MIETFKILHGYYDNVANISLFPHAGFETRGNKYKLHHNFVKYDLKKHFFTNMLFAVDQSA